MSLSPIPAFPGYVETSHKVNSAMSVLAYSLLSPGNLNLSSLVILVQLDILQLEILMATTLYSNLR